MWTCCILLTVFGVATFWKLFIQYGKISIFRLSSSEEAEIPASPSKNCLEGPMAKKHAGDKKMIDKKKKEKKKVLKRLWYKFVYLIMYLFYKDSIYAWREFDARHFLGCLMIKWDMHGSANLMRVCVCVLWTRTFFNEFWWHLYKRKSWSIISIFFFNYKILDMCNTYVQLMNFCKNVYHCNIDCDGELNTTIWSFLFVYLFKFFFCYIIFFYFLENLLIYIF